MDSNKSEFRLPDGIEITSLKGIHEGYSESLTDDGYHKFTINVSVDNISRYFLTLSALVKEPAFFLVETGLNEPEERQLRHKETDPFHKAVYYLDGINFKKAEAFFLNHERLLALL